MKLSTIGIVLLTLMVATKYLISSSTLSIEDGSFKNGIALDYTAAWSEINALKNSESSHQLLAFHALPEYAFEPSSVNTVSISDASVTVEHTFENTGAEEYKEPEADLSADEPIPMDYRHSLVVYDISNPMNNVISSTYEDVADDIPLDNGNTVVSGLLQMMPKR